jgi:transposase InsO family protein
VLRPQFPLAGLLGVAGLARSTFYYQCKALAAPDKHARLKQQIADVFALHKERYGYRRVTLAIQATGWRIDPKTVQRRMVEMGLKSPVRKKVYNSFKGEIGLTAPNHLNRQFEAAGVNQKWVTDVTEFKVPGGKVYLSPIMDLCSGEIITHTMDTRPSLAMVTTMLRNALAELPEGEQPMLHSDQGWQYRMPVFQELLTQRGLQQSMSRKGNCYDNASIESFFAVLKTEYFHLQTFTGTDDLKAGVDEYIRYYNTQRIKTRLGGLTPVAYRNQLSMT